MTRAEGRPERGGADEPAPEAERLRRALAAAEEALRAAEEGERRARAEAETARQAKSEFLATMSHELRTPLTAILGYEELLADGVAGPVGEEQLRQLRRIRASAEHLLELIDAALTFSRIEAGRERARREPVDVAEILGDAELVVAPLAAERGLELRVERPSERVIVETDPGRLRQILLNLLTNAAKFTERGEIALAGRLAGERIEFVVRDTGIGIAAEHHERIFEPFWQVEQRMTRSVGGAGLGLSVSRQLARLLGGELTLISEPGVGSTFVLALPLRADEPGDAD